MPSLESLKGLVPDELVSSLEKESTNFLRRFHIPIITPSRARVQPAAGPAPIVIGSTIGLEYTNIATDAVYRFLKIETSFVGQASFHIHWTKSGNGDESGNTVNWQLDYNIFNGIDEDILANTNTLNLSGTYVDSGTTSRITYRTLNVSVDNLSKGYYVGFKTSVASKTLTSNPVLLAVDLVFDIDAEGT